jgi:arylsulfatase A-like enzyme
MKKNILALLFFCSVALIAQEKPNILWIVTEDISPTLSMYGDTTAKTPTLDKLASESMIYDNVYAPVGVCAPTRSAIITGMYPTSIGTIHMRTGKDTFSWGKRLYKKDVGRSDINGDTIREYSAVIPDVIKCFPEFLRADDYYCTNNAKTDYQFASPITAWDENGNNAHWRNRPEGMSFFSVFNIGITHESRLWKNEDKPLTVSPKEVQVPPYLPDNEATRKTIARHYSNVELMDKEVEKLISQLKEDGLYENTIIFFYSDHGGPLPREKREIYDSGLKVPFFIKGLKSSKTGRTDRLISFVDLAPTILSLANIMPPANMQGKAFLGFYAEEARQYVFGSSDRFDGFTDRIRSVRDKRFLYLKNYYPDLPKYKDIAYRKNIPMMTEMLLMKENGSLSEEELIWFNTKTTEELYDCELDPHNMNNLIEDPKYKKEIKLLRNALIHHQKNNIDLGMLPEAELINKMWPDFQQPRTSNPKMEQKTNKLILTCDTKGASIAYKISDRPNEKFGYDDHWKLYTKPLDLQSGKYYYIIAERIGFRESETIILKM